MYQYNERVLIRHIIKVSTILSQSLQTELKPEIIKVPGAMQEMLHIQSTFPAEISLNNGECYTMKIVLTLHNSTKTG